jgi:hypothetical protein
MVCSKKEKTLPQHTRWSSNGVERKWCKLQMQEQESGWVLRVRSFVSHVNEQPKPNT